MDIPRQEFINLIYGIAIIMVGYYVIKLYVNQKKEDNKNGYR